MFSPVHASAELTKKYYRYLKTIFRFQDPDYQAQFEQQMAETNTLAAGPYLDVTDSFEKAESIEKLIAEGTMSAGFRDLTLPLTRPLYRHQRNAIEKLKTGRNLIVSTGTGSGKTESFLLPILDSLLRERENGTLQCPGVRALLIYPMNALANDQAERLRALLKDCPEITYGSYTGQTKDKYTDALSNYRQLNNGEDPLPNELISREQMKKTPPHLLITNYAMLEYLMLRPADSVFFESDKAQLWKYIVLDEAHVYNGGSGIEVAMLLRRLKATLNNTHIQYILTSATLGDKDSDDEVAAFGQNLCSCEFDRNDIVRACRIVPTPDQTVIQLPMSFYLKAQELLDHPKDTELLQLLHQYNSIDCDISELLYQIILHDSNYHAIKKALAESSHTIQELSQMLHWTQPEIEAFVAVASKAERNGDRLFDARYHMFLRAADSLFVTLSPNKKLFLTRKNMHYEANGDIFAVFEACVCNICHTLFLLGKDENSHLVQKSYSADDDPRSVFLVGNAVSDTDEEFTLSDADTETEQYEVCAKCAFLRRAGLAKPPKCEHGNAYMQPLIKAKVKSETGKLTKCPACENSNHNGILRRFFTGQEAVTSVIGTALFEELPAYSVTIQDAAAEDEFGFGSGAESAVRTEEAKQFIAFSDNRQAAAYYASYFDQTYRNILYKRLIMETITEQWETWNGSIISDFVNSLAAQFVKYHIAEESTEQSLREAWKAVLLELCDQNGTTSIINMGMMSFSFIESLIPPNQKLGLNAEQVCTLCNVFASGMMTNAAIDTDYALTPADTEYFTHNNVQYSYTLSDTDKNRYRRAFIPCKTDGMNKRTEYLMKVLEAAGHPAASVEIANRILESIWKYVFEKQGLLKGSGGVYRISSDKLLIRKPKTLYCCQKCKQLTPFNLYDICPTYHCSGKLESITPETLFKDDHYYQTYREMDIRPLRVVEHTAQLNRETAYEFQKKFKQKQIDVLSCSTTFEMGVDVGSLETVFMRNMPPSPANYAQRAGRAGRSKLSAAYALTFCNMSNHDFSFFQNPVRMIRGRIDPPKFSIENDKIAIRHIFASALSYFWKKYPQYFNNTYEMIESKKEENGTDAFIRYLKGKPDDLRTFLFRFLPDHLAHYFDIAGFGWLERLIGTDEDEPGVLTKAVDEYNYEVGILIAAKKEAQDNGKHSDYLIDRITVYRHEDILSFLSRKNVLPKYGFPVDTVELRAYSSMNRGKLGLELQRDLSMAISEYAPGSQIVANGRLITSRYIRKIPQMGWKMYDYIRCGKCQTLNIAVHTTGKTQFEQCRCCKQEFASVSRTFIVPEFGFACDGDLNKRPGLKKPEKTYRGEISYVGYRTETEHIPVEIGTSQLEMLVSHGDEMAVLNESGFYVCKGCGYTELDEKSAIAHRAYKKVKHKNSGGYPCPCDSLDLLSIGYRFETDVIQIRFLNPSLKDRTTALSVLYGIIRGMCSYLNIEQNDIAGCLQYYQNGNFAIVLYDRTPGGAGHVRRLSEPGVLEKVLYETLQIMQSCTCGGTDGDTSCYICLRNYYNQKYHDELSRRRVIDTLRSVLYQPDSAELVSV